MKLSLLRQRFMHLERLLTNCGIGLFAAALCAVSVSAADYHAGKLPSDLAAQPAYTFDWPEQPDSAVDVSFLLEAPAGEKGRLQSRNGHFYDPDGRRFRMWGVNATGACGLPATNHAACIAANLARLGINCVRFHFLDRPAPAGILAANRNDTRELDPTQLDRLDFFIAQLKQRGIYTDLNLNVARPYKAGDGVKDFELLGFAKAVTFFDPRLLELQREYARQLLTHRNPYTSSTYAREPAVALVEFLNENSLVEAWMDGRLRGKNTRKFPGTWTDIPASYAADLTDQYNAWLKCPPDVLRAWRAEAGVSDGAPIPRLEPDQFARASRVRFQLEAEFYLDIERQYYLTMAKFLREDLGVQALLVANSDHNHYRTGYPQLAGTSLLDVVDGHVYWQHPNYQTDPQTGRQAGFTIGNTPMVDDPLHSTVVQLSRSAFAGKPYIVSEVNHPFPGEYACEGIPILAAYGAFQDWDGIFWYSLAHRDALVLEQRVAGHFDLAMDPVKMSQLPAGALVFLRGDVRPARETMSRSYTRQQVVESIGLSARERPYFSPGFPLSLPLQHGSRIGSLQGPSIPAPQVDAGEPIGSDTGELKWAHAGPATGLVTVDTERTQALIGYMGSRRARLRNFSVDTDTPFCAITLSSLDGEPIARSGKLLLTATARAANSNMEWNGQRNSLVRWGEAPTRIEPVTGALHLANLAPARGVGLTPLDGAGRPLSPRSAATKAGEVWELTLRAPATSYLISVVR